MLTVSQSYPNIYECNSFKRLVMWPYFVVIYLLICQVSGPVLDVLIERLNDLVVIFFDDDDPEDKTFLDQVKSL